MTFNDLLGQLSPFKNELKADEPDQSGVLNIICSLFMKKNSTMDSLVKIASTLPDSLLREMMAEQVTVVRGQNRNTQKSVLFAMVRVGLTRAPKIVSGDSFI